MGSGPGPYQAQILEHYKRPHNRGTLDPATHQARVSNPLCGDEIALTLRVDGERRIEDVRFDGEGCAISMASASLLTDAVKGKSLDEAAAVPFADGTAIRSEHVTLEEARAAFATLLPDDVDVTLYPCDD